MPAGKRSTYSNLDYFLHCTTPVVPSEFLSKSEMRHLNGLWHPRERESVECFRLADLWNCYDEWSAYGAGVPIHLHSSGETLVQYYVPYLSTLQIFTSTPSPHCFSLREDTDSRNGETRDSYSESCSDECESDKLSCKWYGSSSEDGSEQEKLWRLTHKLGYLYYT